ncbi:MAG: hypothetical protein SFT94_02180 [Pseudanabaenaceae cyanobacterium bins.68]|nr:hypothetical protein [Pseudanabaenaceae cyanobacterium bins.68]
MTILSQVREFRVTVGNLDITDNIVSLTLARPFLDFSTPQSWSGSFTVAPVLSEFANASNDATLLDDLANPQIWRRAQQIVQISTLDGGNPLVIFRGYINTYRWNPNPGELFGTGTLFDELGLQMLAKNPELVIKEGVFSMPMWELVKECLVQGSNDADGTVNFGSGNILISNATGIRGNINVPFTTSTPIKTAQDICGVNLLWLYCNNQGQIDAIKCDFGAGSAFTVSLDQTLTFDRDLTVEDYFAEKVQVSGSKQVSVPVVPGVAGEPEPIEPNPDLGTSGGAKDRPLRITTTETKTLGEVTGNFNSQAVVNGGIEVTAPITSTKVIEYTYNLDGEVVSTVTTFSQPLGAVTGTFQIGGKNGNLEPLNFIVDEILAETITTRTETRLRGAITGSFNGNDTINGGLEVTTPIVSTEVIDNLTESELVRVNKRQKNDIPNLKYDPGTGERDLYSKEPLPEPENKIETRNFVADAVVNLNYVPYFKVLDNRRFDYVEDQQMCAEVAAFIAGLELARLKGILIEVALPTDYSPRPFQICRIGEQNYLMDGAQIELQDNQLKLIFTGLPV